MTQQVRPIQCIQTMFVDNHLTVAGRDFNGLMQTFTINQMNPAFMENINLLDNMNQDGKRRLFFRVKGDCGLDEWVEICIWDDESSML